MSDFAAQRVEEIRKRRRRTAVNGRSGKASAVPLGSVTQPFVGSLTEIPAVRTEAAGRIQPHSSGAVLHDVVTVEDVEDDVAPPRSQVPEAIQQPAGAPLLLTDKPWAQMEQERADQKQRELDQQDDPAWQARTHALNRPQGEIGEANVGQIAAKTSRRRGRTLLTTLTHQRGRQVEEQRKVDEDKARTAAEQQRLADEERERQLKEADLAAEPTVRPRVIDAQQFSREVIAVAKTWSVDYSRLAKLNGSLRNLTAATHWSQMDDLLEEINTEATRVSQVRSSVEHEQVRALKLTPPTTPHKRLVEIVAMYSKFRSLAGQQGKDAETTAALVALQDEIQAEEDKAVTAAVAAAERSAAKASANAAAVAAALAEAQQQMAWRAEGLWPGNGRPAARIETKSRANVGASDEERAAVVEALDALKDSTKSHTFARKWGDDHGNSEGNLPGTPGLGGYTEYYVRRAPGQPAPGARRLVKHTRSGFVYYSATHYGKEGPPAFVKVTDA